jgi:hypothetical protein
MGWDPDPPGLIFRITQPQQNQTMRLYIKLENGTCLEAEITAQAHLTQSGKREITLPEFMELTGRLADAVSIDSPGSGITTEDPSIPF